MLSSLKALASTFFLYSVVLGVAVEVPGHFEVNAQPKGIDVSAYQGNVDWKAVVNNGVSFAYIKATEGTTYKNPYFSSQYTGATKAGLIRGGYHFARPDTSSGAAQASWFASNGGGWRGDGYTLPGALDLEGTCYGLKPAAMVIWIHDFSNAYYSIVGRYPVIYTTTDWWKTCTNDSPAFAPNSPLWIVRWGSTFGPLPNGWRSHTFWQYADHGPVPGDQDYYNGNMADLKKFAAS